MTDRKPIYNYRPQTAKVRSWDDIEEHFTKWFQGQYLDNIVLLVKHIKISGLAQRLFGYTSMDKLVVGIYNPLEWNREALHIEFDFKGQKWVFKYYPKPNEPVEFERQYPADKGIENFDNFIKMVKW
ncbi:MAG: hypothetical protein JNM71_15725 [Flavobacterium lindanitolerans]|uniref:hypothetical protein n=1 Tax=Flavobacterium lindanitolerans TaxID=428988 RepID=UPI001A4D47BF|nr:hypothetical protein [Flavobacterium lindanitolerans]MBL7869465.1 hypothetical protein [Flavobacterium lindanitolerans]